MVFLYILIIPIIICLIMFIIFKEITIGEFLIQMGTITAIVGVIVLVIRYQNVTHYEVWNGYVTNKVRDVVHCRHSYDCNCHTECSGSGRDKSCHEECDTCYEHSYDVDWDIYDNTGAGFTIYPMDRQGLVPAPFWLAAQKGDPTSHVHSYSNYIKASSDSLFRKQGLTAKYAKVLPPYPMEIYNYYNLDRIVLVGIHLDDLKKWNYELALLNGTVGMKKQCNTILVLVKNQPEEYLFALEQHWVGANKNDVVLIVSLGEKNEIQWAGVIALVQNSIFKVELRDQIEELKTFDISKALPIIKDNVLRNFKRKRMRDFEYLSWSITPTTTQYVVSIIICTIVSIGLSIFFYKNELTA